MITISVEPYCASCPLFDADVQKLRYSAGGCDTIVYCEHRLACDSIYKHIKNKENNHD